MPSALVAILTMISASSPIRHGRSRKRANLFSARKSELNATTLTVANEQTSRTVWWFQVLPSIAGNARAP
jgi:hypothetical protein